MPLNDLENTSSSIKYGKFLANPPEGEEICITGMSGTFPDSKNVQELKENLFNKKDMVDDKICRWDLEFEELPKRCGRVPDIGKFDAGFFGVHHRQADTMDPVMRIILEKSLEAIFDAGLNPTDLEGTKTGVFLVSIFSDSERYNYFENLKPQQFGITGSLRSMIANKLSFHLKLKGPSYMVDTSCSSGIAAFDNAYRAMRSGLCDTAIVGGGQLLMNPYMSLKATRLGFLSPTGTCRSFDQFADGYVRSEAVSCFILQKSKEAKRIYAKVVHVKTNCDGFKPEGITHPSKQLQKVLLEEFYEECGFDPSNLNYIEAHATGTMVGDPEEFGAIDEFCGKHRKKTHFIGSLKSNIGHTECASAFCGITKCIIAMEEGAIPPNLNYSKPREGLKGLEEGTFVVPVVKTPLPNGRIFMAANSFGFGGVNGHILLESNPKDKICGKNDDIPRILCLSGTTPEAVSSMIDDLHSDNLDIEYIQLIHDIFRKDIPGHRYRGYSIISEKRILSSSCEMVSHEKVPLLLAFGSFDESWFDIYESFSTIPIFRNTMDRILKIAAKMNLDMRRMIENACTSRNDEIIEKVLGIVKIQLGFVDVIKAIDLEPVRIIGYGIGQIACAYYDGSKTLEQSIHAAIETASYIKERSLSYNAVYVVEKDGKEIVENATEGVDILLNNSKTMIVAGERKLMQSTMETIDRIYGTKKIELTSKLLSFSSTSKPEKETSLPNELLTKVFNSKLEISMMPRRPYILEIGDGDFSEILRHSNDSTIMVRNLCENDGINSVVRFLEIIGSLYNLGFNPQIQKLYPQVKYPVSRSTPMISPKVKWNHSNDWFVYRYLNESRSEQEHTVVVSLAEEKWQYLRGNIINGRILFPVIGYLQIIREFLAMTRKFSKYSKVIFENCQFFRQTILKESEVTVFTVSISKKRGKFEICESKDVLCSGTVKLSEKAETKTDQLNLYTSQLTDLPVKKEHIYKELRLRGYDYRYHFMGIEECDVDVTEASIEWSGNWVTFLDYFIHLKILHLDSRTINLPIRIERLSIDSEKHMAFVESYGKKRSLPLHYIKTSDILRCGGIEMNGLVLSPIAKEEQLTEPLLESYEFVPNETFLQLHQSLRIILQIALENLQVVKLKILELIDEATDIRNEPAASILEAASSEQPIIQTEIKILENTWIEKKNVLRKSVVDENAYFLVVASKLSERPSVLKHAFSVLKEGGFILSRERGNFDVHKINDSEIQVLAVHRTESEKLVLLRQLPRNETCHLMNISDKDLEFKWLTNLQRAIEKNQHIIIYAQNEKINGIMGLFNCLKKETGGGKITCFLLYDGAPQFRLDDRFYRKQLKKNLAVNVYKNGTWGTYRHIPIMHSQRIEPEHLYSAVTSSEVKSVEWTRLKDGNLEAKRVHDSEKTIVQIYYAPLNYKDVVVANGRVCTELLVEDRITDYKYGLEFVGRVLSGKRVMGLKDHGALSTVLQADPAMTWTIPSNWTMEEAATVPLIYSTTLYSLLERGKIKLGESILIISGDEDVGKAAINISLACGLNVFTTVKLNGMKNCLKGFFPQLEESHIECSTEILHQTIKRETNGHGVDVLFNGSGSKTVCSSIRILSEGGRLLHVGRIDIQNTEMLLLKHSQSLHGIRFDQFMRSSPKHRNLIKNLLENGISDGLVRPIERKVFEIDQLEKAFQFMTSDKKVGKVIIRIREEEEEQQKSKLKLIKSSPRYQCYPEELYIIIGGLGGIGMELIDWLILRGARKILISSRKGTINGYCQYRIRLWRSYGALIKISTSDITRKEGCEKLILEAEQLGAIHGIFNLAAVLLDSLLENQTSKSLKESFGSKALATKYLDEITRIRCRKLRLFVVFSSIICGRGNIGQINYGMTNSVMERVCEERKRNGYPALAIQWGTVGNVGLIAEGKNNIDISAELMVGVLQQKINSCFQAMDTFLCQNESAVVSSIVVAKKRCIAGESLNIVDSIVKIIGIKRQTVSMNALLSEIGMDSMIAVEIKHVLERDFDLSLTTKDIRKLTLAKLMKFQCSTECSTTMAKKEKDVEEEYSHREYNEAIGDSLSKD